MKIAIDIGSNTLKIATFDGQLRNYETVLNLGLFYENEEINNTGINVLLAALDGFAKTMDLTKASVVATAIFRKSKNAKKIANILRQRYGFNLCILTQTKEAELTRLGVGLNGDFSLVDIGGYSSEISTLNNSLMLDIGLLSFYKIMKERKIQAKNLANELLSPYKKRLDGFARPVVLASKTGIFAKSIQDGVPYEKIDDLAYHNTKLTKSELVKLVKFIENANEQERTQMLGKNRDFAVYCGAFFIDTLFSDNEFIISAYGLKEGLLRLNGCKF